MARIEAEQLKLFVAAAPYSREIGLALAAAADDRCVLELPYRPDLVGDPDTGVLHGGVITAMLDVALACAVLWRLQAPRLLATLDLRIDYLKPATPDRTVYAAATCHKITADLAFARGVVYHDSPDDPISTGVGIFMFTDPPRPRAGGGSAT